MNEPLAEKLVQPAINPQNLEYCPSMDLIALTTVDEQLYVYRLNGEKVFGGHHKQNSQKIRRLRWKPNGETNVYRKSIHAEHSSYQANR